VSVYQLSIKNIVVHCSDTPNDREVTAEEIHHWHKENNWSGIGYHAVIRRNGVVESGRPIYWKGSHVGRVGRNHDTLGVCLVGRDEYTEAQLKALRNLIEYWQESIPKAAVVGHCDLDGYKTCPNFDAGRWFETGEFAKSPV